MEELCIKLVINASLVQFTRVAKSILRKETTCRAKAGTCEVGGSCIVNKRYLLPEQVCTSTVDVFLFKVFTVQTGKQIETVFSHRLE
jgi:hypothetical protein